MIPHLHSCLDEIIWTAVLRFEQMGLVQINGYGNKQARKTNFLMSDQRMMPKVQETLEFMQSLRLYSKKEALVVDEEVQNAVMRA